MNQAELFLADPTTTEECSAVDSPPAPKHEQCERDVLRAMELYHDHYPFEWEPDCSFNSLNISYMVSCQAEGPFCIWIIPRLVYSVEEIILALGRLVRRGEVIEERKYYGSDSPGNGDYRGYGYRYTLEVKS